MEIKVTGTFSVAQAVALEMKKANVSGSMVLVASMSETVVNKACFNCGQLFLTRKLTDVEAG
jgi:NAD(P)-dependent dehydrogenase (short-subunit alcohol dehydrogenase family)